MSARLKDALPEFAQELSALLLHANQPDLADQVSQLPLVERCRCGDDFCATFYTAPRPNGPFGQGHSCLMLSPKDGMVILDLVAGEIRCVEVLDRPDVERALSAVMPL